MMIRFRTVQRPTVAVVVALASLTACRKAQDPARLTPSMRTMVGAGSPDVKDYPPEVKEGYDRVRAATAPYRTIDGAVAAGYPRSVPQCFTDSLHLPAHGAMGYHHLNRDNVDMVVDLAKPEILLYERLSDGTYQLNGVEFLVPYRFRPRDSVPPKVMGRDMFPDDTRNYWYAHMWVWKRNPAGLFADWNPAARCPGK